MIRPFTLLLVVLTLSCGSDAQNTNQGTPLPSPSHKSDHGELSDVQWANQVFLTQIYHSQWNPDGAKTHTDSNSCGPASLAMLMQILEQAPESLSP